MPSFDTAKIVVKEYKKKGYVKHKDYSIPWNSDLIVVKKDYECEQCKLCKVYPDFILVKFNDDEVKRIYKDKIAAIFFKAYVKTNEQDNNYAFNSDSE